MWAARMQREMADLTRAPPPGISCFPVDGTSLNHLEAHVSGPPGTVYAGGVFKLDVRIPDRCVGAVPGAGVRPGGQTFTVCFFYSDPGTRWSHRWCGS